jgi:receptor protein-tyrosine kinase
MTDKTSPSLNLIERMAQRLAAGETQSAPPASVVAEVAPRAEPHPVPVEVAPPPKPEDLRRTPVGAAEPDSARRPSGSGSSRQVSLDFRALRQNGMVTPDNMGSVISNEFRGIKRKLLQKARDPESRALFNNLVMVTSSLPGEGKTFTSVNLAISLAAERGLQVLLVDADVVRPAIGNVFKSTPREGLTELLSSKSLRVSDVMCRCAEIPNLAVIFSGHARVDSPELISSSRMVDLCRELSNRYSDRIVIIDTPPVLASPEPATLASYVHQVIMVVAADQTNRYQLRKSLESVASCSNVSLLFNKASKWTDSEYRSYYGYASSHAASAQSTPS